MKNERVISTLILLFGLFTLMTVKIGKAQLPTNTCYLGIQPGTDAPSGELICTDSKLFTPPPVIPGGPCSKPAAGAILVATDPATAATLQAGNTPPPTAQCFSVVPIVASGFTPLELNYYIDPNDLFDQSQSTHQVHIVYTRLTPAQPDPVQ